MDADPLDGLQWDESAGRWYGLIDVALAGRIEIVVQGGRRDPAIPLALAKLAFSLIQPRIDEAQTFAAKELLEYYNVFNAHLANGEQLTEAEFASRLELEAISFKEKGSSTLEFKHSLYRGYRNWEGGMIVVMARFDGEFRKAAWVTAADAEEWREQRRGKLQNTNPTTGEPPT